MNMPEITETQPSPPVRLSVVALCFNHRDFLDEALESLEGLDPASTQIIVADDGSTDGSREKLAAWQQRHPDWIFIADGNNLGNCRRFNQALALCRGEWVLDFATDDRLRPEQIPGWLDRAGSGSGTGFCYADALIFGDGGIYGFRARSGRKDWPEGNILSHLAGRPFICPPAVLFNRAALQAAGGYDESLAYEDWDIWLRLARRYRVVSYGGCVVEYRQHPRSLSASLYREGNPAILRSTLSILEKVLSWPECSPGFLTPFIRYHLRLSVWLGRPEEAAQFFHLLFRSGKPVLSDRIWYSLRGRIPFVRKIYRLARLLRGG